MNSIGDLYYRNLTKTSFLVTQVLFILMLAFIYYYLHRLQVEKCECAMTSDYVILRRLVVVVLSLMSFLAVVSLVVQYVYTQKPSALTLNILYGLAFATSIIDLVFLIISLRYIVHLYKISCQCSDNSMRLVYLIYTILRVALIAIVVIGLFFMFIFLAIFLSRLSSKKK